jgi:rhodanese-related sulfurtransferase
LLDVREDAEVKEGIIPTAQHISISQIPTAFQLKETEFRDAFGFDKPNKDDLIVTYCKLGMRAANSAQMLKQLGYKNVAVYQGSWQDWQG